MRKSTTQLMATPTLHGKDAQRLLDSLSKPTERSKRNGERLVKYFKSIERCN